MIKVENISKSFGDNHVLQDVSATFYKGKVNAIIGGSGSGKSVFMKCIVGLFNPDQGNVFYEKTNFTTMDYDEKSYIRRQIGMLFQGSALFDSLSVEENIAFPLQIFTNQNAKEIKERVDFCLDKVNLGKVNDLLPSEISGGMKKRVGIARSIVLNPKYLFVDEPNSGLDPKTAIVIDNLIKQLTEDFNTTTIVITHDMNTLFEVCDHTVFLKDGKNCWEGVPAKIRGSNNKDINEFVYAAKFIREQHAVES